MPKNKLSDLRNHLFETLERLKDEENPMDLDRAKTVSLVAGTLIETAKVEIQFAEAIGAQVSPEFFDTMAPSLQGETAPGLLPGRKAS